jgi:hypothetical protein
MEELSPPVTERKTGFTKQDVRYNVEERQGDVMVEGVVGEVGERRN